MADRLNYLEGLLVNVRKPSQQLQSLSDALYHRTQSRGYWYLCERAYEAQDRNHFEGTPLDPRCDAWDNRRA